MHRDPVPTVRAALLANEIKKQKPDIVGLQEAAWWRTGPYDLSAVTGGPKATQTDPQGGDFLSDLLAQLNKGGKKRARRSAAAAKKKKPAAALPDRGGEDGVRLRAARQPGFRRARRLPGPVPQRAPDDARRDPGPQGRQGEQRDAAAPSTRCCASRSAASCNVDVTRGWAAADLKVNGRKVHVVDSHFEAFDSGSSNTGSDGQTYPKGGIREAQAKQLIAPGGPATSKLPTLLIGDFNSDSPVHGDQVDPGDALAYRALLAGGWSERAFTPPPFGCCIQDPNLSDPSTRRGHPPGRPHHVQHARRSSSRRVV